MNATPAMGRLVSYHNLCTEGIRASPEATGDLYFKANQSQRAFFARAEAVCHGKVSRSQIDRLRAGGARVSANLTILDFVFLYAKYVGS